ncbi:MAG: polyprenyl diphosphate synthase [Planctomycetota bacterium]
MSEELRPDFPVPRHVGIIMDGNGRWAKRSGLIRLRGHEAGVEAVRDTVEAAAEWGIEHLTLYAFSVENWQRPKAEIEGLMRFLKRFLKAEKDGLIKNRIRLKGLGRLDDLPAGVRDALREVEAATLDGDRMTLRLALSYGGRQEILDGVQAMMRKVAAGEMKPEDATVEAMAAHLYDPSMPDPDLIVRSAGEIRLSNFLLWQASYSEFHFTETMWPEFRRQHLLEALRDYHSRVRRFGKVLDRDPAVEKSKR